MLRLLLAALLLANLLYLAWAQGWLSPMLPAPRDGDREPHRLAGQVRPEVIQILPAGGTAAPAPPVTAPARPASASALACLEAGPFAPGQLTVATSVIVTAGVPSTSLARVAVGPAVPEWLVYAGRFSDAGARRGMQQQWQQAGVASENLDAPPELAPGLVLSRHPGRDAAETALRSLPAEVTQVVRVVVNPAPSGPMLLRVAAADETMQARLAALPAPLEGAFRPCAVAGTR